MRLTATTVLVILALIASSAHAYKAVYALFVDSPETLRPEKTLPMAIPVIHNIVLRYGYREMQWSQRAPAAKDAKSGDRAPELSVRVLVFDPKDSYNRYGSVFGAFDGLGRDAARAAYKGQYYLKSAVPNAEIQLLKTNVQESEYPVRRDGTSPGDPSRRVLSDHHFLEFVETYSATTYAHEQYSLTYMEQVANVRIEITERWAQGAVRPFPEHRTIAGEVIASMTGKPGGEATEVAPVVPVAPKEVEATHRPELAAQPTRTGQAGTAALIPATDQLPAKLSLRGGKPNSNVVFHLRREGGLLKAHGKQEKYELPVRVDSLGNAEIEFFYAGGPVAAPVEFEVIAMNEGKKATASVVVGLGLDFSRLRAIQGQSYISNIYAFSLGVKSRFHPKLDVANYLYTAEQSQVWGERTLGIRIAPQWMNRDTPGDVAYDWTTTIKPLPGGNGLVATDSAEKSGQPYYVAPKFNYPAVRLESSGKHIYRVEGQAVAMRLDGIVTSREEDIREPAMSNQALLVMTIDPSPDSYFKMLACSLDAQDGIQWLIWEGAKAIPAAGTVFDGVQTGAGILCKLTAGDYENAFYDFANFAGGKALDKLGSRLKENPDKYSQKVHSSYKQAQFAYDKLMEKKNTEERDRLIQKSLEKYGLSSTKPLHEDDIGMETIQGERRPTIKTPAASVEKGKITPASPSENQPADSKASTGSAELDKSFDDLKKSVQQAEHDLRNLGDSLKKLFK